MAFALITTIFAQNPPASVAVVPYACDFEDESENANWFLGKRNAGSTGWFIGDAVSVSGSHALYISSTNGLSNYYDVPVDPYHSSVPEYYAYRMVQFPRGEYEIAFNFRCNNSVDTNNFRVALVPDYALNSSSQAGWIFLDENKRVLTEDLSWRHFSAIYKNPTVEVQSYYLVFLFYGNYHSELFQPPAAVDNITITPLPCQMPINLTATQVTTNSAIVSWTPRSSETRWRVEYGLQGFTLGEGTVVTVSDTFCQLTDLYNNSNYDVYVQALCETPSLAAHTTLHTLRESGSFPYTTDFDNLSDNVNWYGYSYYETNYNYEFHIGHFFAPAQSEDDQALYLGDIGQPDGYFPAKGVTTAARDLAVNEAGYYTVSFDVISKFHQANSSSWSGTTSQSTYNVAHIFLAPTETFTYDTVRRVLTSSDHALPTSWISIDRGVSSITSSTWSSYSNDIYVPAAGNYTFVVLLVTSDPYAYSLQTNIAINNLQISSMQCPRVSNLQLSDTLPRSVHLSWEAGANENRWIVEYGFQGFSRGTGTTRELSATSTTLTNLLPNHSYDIYVYAKCQGSETLSAPERVSFTTPEALATVPYSHNFSDEEENDSWVLSSYEDYFHWYIGTPNGTDKYAYLATDSLATLPLGLNYPYSYMYRAVAAYRNFHFEPGTYKIELDWKAVGGQSEYARLYLLPTTSTNSMTSYSLPYEAIIIDGNQRLNNSIGWERLSENFEITTAGDYRLVLSYNINASNNIYTSSNPLLHVDNIRIVSTACAQVSDLQVANITALTADVTWSAGAGPSSYVIEYGNAGFILGTGRQIAVNTNSYALSNLIPAQNYDLYVAHICATGDTSAFKRVRFQTSSLIASVPYTCNFEAEEDLQYWNLYNGTSQNRWCVGSAVNNGGEQSLYISDDGGVSNAYNVHTSAPSFSYVTAWVGIDFTQGDFVMSYDWKNDIQGYYAQVYIIPDSYTVPDGQQWSQVFNPPYDWIRVYASEEPTTEYTRTVTSFTIPQAGRYKVIFYWNNYARSGDPLKQPISIDNIHIQSLSCPFATDMAATTITDQSITLTWNAISANGWLFEYGERPFIPGTGTQRFVPAIAGNATATVTLSQLMNNTTYDIHVWSICGTDTCPVPSLTVETAVGEPATIPYHCDFEATSPDLRSWIFVDQSNTLLSWNIGSAINHGGERALYISYDRGATHALLSESTCNHYVGREIYFPEAGQYTIAYDWISESSNDLNDSYLSAALSPRGTTLTPNTYFSNAWLSMDDNYSDGLTSSTEWKTNIQIFNIEEPGVYTLVFSWYNGYNCCGGNVVPPAIDNIHVDFVTCPIVRNLQAENVTSQSISLLWEQGNSETRWKIEYGKKNFELGTGTTLYATRVSQTLSNLEDNTEYDIYVYAICGDDNLSPYKKLVVKTLPEPITLPFVCDFEDIEQYRSFTYNRLPQENSWAIGNKVDAPNTALFVTPDAGANYGYMSHGSYANEHCWREVYLEQGVEYTFSFDWQNNTIDSLDDYFRVALVPYREIRNGYIPVIPYEKGGYNTVSFLPLDGGKALNGSEGWQTYTTAFRIPSYEYEHAILTFFWRNDTDADEGTLPAAIDNVEFRVSDCPAPTDITATTTHNSISLRWRAASQERQWHVEYGLSGFERGTGTSMTVNGTPQATLNNLLGWHDYDIYISSVCSEDSESIPARTTVRTQVNFAAIPYSDSFEEETQNALWVFYNGDNRTNDRAAAWFINRGPVSGSGLYSLYVSHTAEGNSVSYNWDASSVSACRGLHFAEAGEYSIAFDWNGGGELNKAFMRVALAPASDFEAIGTVSFSTEGVPNNWIPLDYNTQMNLSNGWRTDTSGITIAEAGDYFLVFYWQNNQQPPLSQMGIERSVAVDNIEVKAVTCRAPQQLTSAEITHSSVEISWSDPNQSTEWVVEYGLQGFLMGNGTSMRVTAPTVTISNLRNNTEYDIYVRSVCSEESVSPYSLITIKTEHSIPTAPYYCDFETQAENDNWDVSKDGPNFWAISNQVDDEDRYMLMVGYENYAHNFVHEYQNELSISRAYRPIRLEAGEYNFSLKWRCGGNDNAYYRVALVPASSSPSAATPLNATVLPDGWIAADGGSKLYTQRYPVFQTDTFALDVPDSGLYYICFAWYNMYSYRTNQPPTAIDHLKIEQLSCPSVNDLVVADLTADAVVITWNERGAATNWRVELLPEGTTPGSGTITIVDQPTITYNNLPEGVNYTVQVRAICSATESSNVSSITFFQPTASMLLPFVCDFEDDTQNQNWNIINGTQRNQWTIGSATGNSGNALYISQDAGTTHTYNTNYSSIVYATQDLYFDRQGEYLFSFDWKGMGESNYDFLRVALAPSDATLTAGSSSISTYSLPTGWIALDGGNQLGSNNSWQTKSYTHSITETGIYKLVFFWRNDGSAGSQPPAAVDNILVKRVTCYPISDYVVNATHNAATIVLQGRGNETSYDIEYGEDGFVRGEGISFTTTHDTLFLTNLSQQTSYDLYVTSHCDDGETSETILIEFQTDIDCVGLPYSCSFEEATENSEWILLHSMGQTSWVVGAATHCGEGSQALYLSADGTTQGMDAQSRHTTISRGIRFDQPGSYTISFDWKGMGTELLASFVPSSIPVDPYNIYSALFNSESYNVVFNAVGYNEERFNYFLVEEPEWVRHTATLDITTPGSYRLVFFATNNYAITDLDNPTAIDNIEIKATPQPTPLYLEVPQRTANSLTLSWNRTSGANSWRVYYGLANSDRATFASVVVTDTATVLTNLLPQTRYEVGVAPIVGGVELPLISKSAVTRCDAPLSLPYYEGVTDFICNTRYMFNPCWYMGGTVPYSQPTIAYDYAIDSLVIGVQPQAYSSIYFTLPKFNESIQSMKLSFDYRTDTYGYSNPDFYIGILTDPEDFSTFQSVARCQIPANGEWTNYEFSFEFEDNLPDGYLAFAVYNNTSRGVSQLYIDEIKVVKIANCRTPNNVSLVSVSGTEAALTWQISGASQQYAVAYSTDIYFDPDTCQNLHYCSQIGTTLTQLQPTTNYYCYVKSVCEEGSSPWSPICSFHTLTDCEVGTSVDVRFNGEHTTNTMPFGTFWTRGFCPPNFEYSLYPLTRYVTWQIFSIEELQAMGVTAGNINAMGFQYATSNGRDSITVAPNIYMKEFNTAELAKMDTLFLSDMHLVYQGTHIFNTQEPWGYLTLDTPFPYSGSRHLMIAVENIYHPSVTHQFFSRYSDINFSYYEQDFVIQMLPSDQTVSVQSYHSTADVNSKSSSLNYRVSTFFDVCATTYECGIPENVTVNNEGYNFADVSWQSEATTFDVAVVLNNKDITDNDIITTTDKNLSLTNLTPGTLYNVMVREHCGDHAVGQWTRPVPLRTYHDSLPIPYFENFEQYSAGCTEGNNLTYEIYRPATYPFHTLPDYWKQFNMQIDTAQYPQAYIYALPQGNVNAGNKFLALESKNSQPVLAILPYFREEIDSLRLEFEILKNPDNASVVELGLLTDRMDQNSFILLDTIEGEGLFIHDFILDTLPARQYWITLRVTNAGEQPKAVTVDNVKVYLVPECIPSIHLEANNVTSTTADLTWWNIDQDQYVVSVTDIEHPDDSEQRYYTANVSYTLTDLMPYRSYSVKVGSVCDVTTNDIEWSESITINTPIDCTTDSLLTVQIGQGDANTVLPFVFEYQTNAKTTMLYTKEELSAQNLHHGKIYSAMFQLAPGAFPLSDHFDIYLSEVAEDTLSQNTVVQPALMHKVYSGEGYRLRDSQGNVVDQSTHSLHDYDVIWAEVFFDSTFYYTGEGSLFMVIDRLDNPFHYNFEMRTEFMAHTTEHVMTQTYIEQYDWEGTFVTRSEVSYLRPNLRLFTCGETPECARPRSITPEQILLHSVDISWVSDADSCEVAYGLEGFSLQEPESFSTIRVSGNYATLSNLAQATTYDVYVRALCNPARDWSMRATVTTLCGIEELPYLETFEVLVGTIPTDLPECWSQESETNAIEWKVLYNDTTYALKYPARTNIILPSIFTPTTTTTSSPKVISPAINLSNLREAELQFDSYQSEGAILVYYRSTVLDTWTELGQVEASSSWQRSNFSLPNMSGTYQVAFASAQVADALWIDNVEIVTPPIFEVTVEMSVENGNPHPQITPGTVSGAGSYERGTEVTLTAEPSNYYHFVSWNDGNTDNPRTFTITRDSLFVAIFAVNEVDVQVSLNVDSMGTLQFSSEAPYAMGQTLTLTVQPNPHHHFVNWSDGSTDNPRTELLLTPLNLVANLAINQYYISVEAPDTVSGRVFGSGLYDYATQVEIRAEAKRHYHFVSWNDGNTDNPRMVTVTGYAMYLAQFAPDPVQVTATVNVDTMGTVELIPEGPYYYGQSITVIATPAEHHHFVSWEDGDQSSQRSLTLTQDTTLVATFAADQYYISVEAPDTVSGRVFGSGLYDYGTQVEIRAEAKRHYHFVSWNDGNTENPRMITVTGYAMYLAQFAPDPVQVTATVNVDTMGTVELSPEGPYYYGQSITVIATPAEHHHFVSWEDGDQSSQRSLTLTQDTTLVATFAADQYYISVEAPDTVSGRVFGSGLYDYGTQVEIRAEAKRHYHFVSWNDGNTENPRMITVSRDTFFVAAFAPDPVQVTATVNVDTMGTVELIPEGPYYYGQSITVIATPAEHHHFVSWEDGDQSSQRSVTLTQDTTLVATFAADQFNITVQSADETMGTVSGSGTYNYGEEVTIVATANENHRFVSWNDGDTASTRTIIVVDDATYVATFESTVGTEDYNLATQVQLMPNPASDWVKIVAPMQIRKVVIFDNNGKVMKQLIGMDLHQVQVGVSTWPAGLYYVRIYTEKGEVTKKLIVKP